jgi:uncharacterized protein
VSLDWQLLVAVLAGVGSGALNAAAGGGVLIAYPLLLVIGLAPVTANATSTAGALPTAVGAAISYRAELRSQAALIRRLAQYVALGGLAGATLLLVLPASSFEALVPWLVLAATLSVAVQPLLANQAARAQTGRDRWLGTGTALSGVYGGYFGAGNSVLMFGVLGWRLPHNPHQLNALKNCLVGVANLAGTVVLAGAGLIDWGVAAALAVGSFIGGRYGAAAAKHLPPNALRGAICIAGIAVTAFLLSH